MDRRRQAGKEWLPTKKTLFIVSSKPDAGLSNEILHLIREDEMKSPGLSYENNLRIVTMNEDQWRLHKNAIIPKYHVLFIGLPEQGRWLPENMAVKFTKYGITYGWTGWHAFLTVDERKLKGHDVYSRFLKELKELCSLEDIIQSPKRLDALQLVGMLCVALLVPFGSVLVGGKLIKDWYANDNLMKKQQYVYGIFHLYRNHLKEFMDREEPV